MMWKFLLTLPLFLFSQSPIRHTYLTWTREDTSRSMTINVHTEGDLDILHLYYAEEGREFRHQIVKIGQNFLPETANRYLFQFELTHLKPGKAYEFIVGDPIHGFTEPKKFRTIPIDAEVIRFVEGGDFELTENAYLVAKEAAKQDPHAALLGGDYPKNALTEDAYDVWDDWLDMYTETMITPEGYLIPMVMAIGNHEVIGGFDQTPENCPFFLDYFPQNAERKTYFYKIFGDEIVLYILDSGHTAPHSGEQRDWFKEALQETENMQIKFVSYHVPLYPSVRFAQKDLSFRFVKRVLELCGMHENPEKLLCAQTALGRRHWLPLFDEFSIKCAFEHHDQTLKRTKFLRGGEEDPNGTLFLGDGGWGPLIQYTPIQSYFRPYFAYAIGHIPFFWLVEVGRDGIKYQAIQANGQMVDECFQKIHK